MEPRKLPMVLAWGSHRSKLIQRSIGECQTLKLGQVMNAMSPTSSEGKALLAKQIVIFSCLYASMSPASLSVKERAGLYACEKIDNAMHTV